MPHTKNKSLTASQNIIINSKADEIWDVLTNPEKIKKYLFGTQLSTDWKPGSPISFQIEFKGQTYVGKGKVINIKPFELLEYSYWNNFSQLKDKPENYSIEVLSSSTCEFTWHQRGFAKEE